MSNYFQSTLTTIGAGWIGTADQDRTMTVGHSGRRGSILSPLLMLLLLLLLPMIFQQAVAGTLNVQAVDAGSGTPIANLEVHAFEQNASGQKIWRTVGTTDETGRLLMDLAGLGNGTEYILISQPFDSGWSVSETITQSGSFRFSVGKLRVTARNGSDSTLLVGHRVGAIERMADGTESWRAEGVTDSNGIVKFDLEGLGEGRRYFLYSYSPFDGRYVTSDELSGNGDIDFVIGSPLLNVVLRDSIDQTPLGQQLVYLIQQQPNGDITWLEEGTTDSNGRISFAVDGFGGSQVFKLAVSAYNGVWSYSRDITQPGEFYFDVGTLQVSVINGIDGTPLGNARVGAFERRADGSEVWVTEGVTDSAGSIRFDLPGLGAGRNYYLYSFSALDGSFKTSNLLTDVGSHTFIVGSSPLRVNLINGLSGIPVTGQEVHVLRRGNGDTLDWLASGTTDDQGNVILDVGSIEPSSPIVIATAPYNGGWVLSRDLFQTGNFTFEVGMLPVRLFNADSGMPIAGKELVLLQKDAGGQLRPVNSGISDADGKVVFDAPELDQGGIYTVYVGDALGLNKSYFSPWITKSGMVDFPVSLNEDSTLDTESPNISIGAPVSGSIVSSGGFTVRGLASDNLSLAGVHITIQDPVVGTSVAEAEMLGSEWHFDIPSTMLSENAVITLSAAAIDRMGNESVKQIELTTRRDMAAPVLQIVSHRNGDTVSAAGFLLSGSVTDDFGVKKFTVTVWDPSQGYLEKDRSIDISPDSGNWAVSVAPLSPNQAAIVILQAADYAGNQVERTLNLSVVPKTASLLQLISRISFGATPEFLQLARNLGRDAFIEQQLNPQNIDDSALDAILETMGDPQTYADLQDYQLARAIYSKRQLLEVMTWFWDNHFSTNLQKSGSVANEKRENDLFRVHALGRFRDLLEVSATSPSMMVYLDNQYNVSLEPNENYARELMELHTLGEDGGYTAGDVAEVARVFTGWSVDNDQFVFKDQFHDNSAKTVLGHVIDGGRGMQEGEEVLDILASHPSTARHICTKLIQLFVSDNAEQTAVNDCASVFLGSDGDIRQVVGSILRSNDFLRSDRYQSKMKTPLEFVVGIIRNSGAEISYDQMRNLLYAMNMLPFFSPRPTGWPEEGIEWANADQLAWRIYLASILPLTEDEPDMINIPDPAEMFIERGYETPEAIIGHLYELAVNNDYSEFEWNTAMNILTAGNGEVFDIRAPGVNQRLRKLIAFVLSSPAYQLQ